MLNTNRLKQLVHLLFDEIILVSKITTIINLANKNTEGTLLFQTLWNRLHVPERNILCLPVDRTLMDRTRAVDVNTALYFRALLRPPPSTL